MSSWERGYGDFAMRPDLETLRPVPWQEGTAMCLADLAWADGTDVAASPRQVLRAAARAAGRARLEHQREHRARVPGLPRQLRGRLAQGLPRSGAGQPLQRRLLDARHRPDRAADPPDPQLDDGRGPGGRELQGRVQLRPARDQLPLRRRAAHRRRPLDLQERRQGDRRPGGDGDQLHGEVQRARGQLVSHPLLALRRRGTGVRRATADCSSRSWPASSRACAS